MFGVHVLSAVHLQGKWSLEGTQVVCLSDIEDALAFDYCLWEEVVVGVLLWDYVFKLIVVLHYDYN